LIDVQDVQDECTISYLEVDLSSKCYFLHLVSGLKGRFFLVGISENECLSLALVMRQLLLFGWIIGCQMASRSVTFSLSRFSLPRGCIGMQRSQTSLRRVGTWAFPLGNQDLQLIWDSILFHPNIALFYYYV